MPLESNKDLTKYEEKKVVQIARRIAHRKRPTSAHFQLVETFTQFELQEGGSKHEVKISSHELRAYSRRKS